MDEEGVRHNQPSFDDLQGDRKSLPELLAEISSIMDDLHATMRQRAALQEAERCGVKIGSFLWTK